MSTDIFVTTTVTVGLAFLGYIITYFNNLRLSQRSERLERINSQLRELYGPMLALVNASNIAWKAFRAKYRINEEYYFDNKDLLNDEELNTWRLWITNVFMPINVRLYEIILTKSDLLIESQMPQCLLFFCAHVSVYQAVIKRWEQNDFSEYVSLIDYPAEELLVYAQSSFENLKSQQEKLTGNKIVTQPETQGIPNSSKLEIKGENPLTSAELKIFQLLLDNLTDKEIADRVGIQRTSAKNHIMNIYRKYGVKNRMELSAKIKKQN